jgi:membrane associated rhomboid family serine protease
MIGASGAVFGLLGTVLRWRSRPISFWRVLLVLVLLSLPAEFLVGGPVAWQAHLGGFLAGWVLGRVFPVRRRIIHPFM